MNAIAYRVIDFYAPGTSVVDITMQDVSGEACRMSIQTGAVTSTHRVIVNTATGYAEGTIGRGPELVGPKLKVFPALMKIDYTGPNAPMIRLAFSIDPSVIPVARIVLRSRTAPDVVETVQL